MNLDTTNYKYQINEIVYYKGTTQCVIEDIIIYAKEYLIRIMDTPQKTTIASEFQLSRTPSQPSKSEMDDDDLMATIQSIEEAEAMPISTGRFVKRSEAEIDDLIKNRTSKNTQAQTKWGMKILMGSEVES